MSLHHIPRSERIRAGNPASEARISDQEGQDNTTIMKLISVYAWIALEILTQTCQSLQMRLNSLSRPDWEIVDGWRPWSQQSFDIGAYEYELMVYHNSNSRPSCDCIKKNIKVGNNLV